MISHGDASHSTGLTAVESNREPEIVTTNILVSSRKDPYQISKETLNKVVIKKQQDCKLNHFHKKIDITKQQFFRDFSLIFHTLFSNKVIILHLKKIPNNTFFLV